jgi:cytochrome c biogenesis protein CcmG, thiol:disulfide interchange protein DsbE
MKRLLFASPVLVALIFGGFFLWGLDPDRNPNAIPSVLISRPAPEFTLPEVAGTGVPGFSRANLVGNSEPVVVNVFASWCVPCRAEHAVLTRMVEEDGVRLFGINYQDEPEDALRWLNEMGNPYERIGSDLNGRVAIDWGLTGVPETFIVGGDGTVLYKYVGPILGETAIGEFMTALALARAEGSS